MSMTVACKNRRYEIFTSSSDNSNNAVNRASTTSKCKRTGSNGN